MFPLEFRGKVNHEETRVMGLSSSEDRMNDRSWSRFDTVPASDRRTDGRTDGQTDGRIYDIANTALSIVSYADAL